MSVGTPNIGPHSGQADNRPSLELLGLHQKIIYEVVDGLKDDWQDIEIDFEYYPWKGDYRIIHQSKYYKSRTIYQLLTLNKSRPKHQFTLGIDAVDAFIALNDRMAEGGKERWTRCHLTVDDTGKYDLQLGYGMPPLLEQKLKLVGEI